MPQTKLEQILAYDNGGNLNIHMHLNGKKTIDLPIYSMYVNNISERT